MPNCLDDDPASPLVWPFILERRGGNPVQFFHNSILAVHLYLSERNDVPSLFIWNPDVLIIHLLRMS